MDILNIIFGIVTVVAFAFTIFAYYKTENQKTIEAANNARIREMIKNTHNDLIVLKDTIDVIIQTPNQRTDVKVEDMQTIARIARHHANKIIQQIVVEDQNLKDWEFGKFLESTVNRENIK